MTITESMNRIEKEIPEMFDYGFDESDIIEYCLNKYENERSDADNENVEWDYEDKVIYCLNCALNDKELKEEFKEKINEESEQITFDKLNDERISYLQSYKG